MSTTPPPPPSWQTGTPQGPEPTGGGWKRIVPAVLGVLVLVAAIVVIVVVLAMQDDSDTDEAGGGSSETSPDDTGSTDASDGTDPGSAPTDASDDEFCDTLDGVESFADDDEIDGVGAAASLVETGTPEDTPDRARDGFETYVAFLEEVDGLSEDEAGDRYERELADASEVTAFFEFVIETCGDDEPREGGGSGGSEGPSDPRTSPSTGIGGEIGGDIDG